MRTLLTLGWFTLLVACTSQKSNVSEKNMSMKIELITKDQARIIPVSPSFKITEYGHLGQGKTNGTVAEVNGRYPKSGWGRNTISDELVYVISGSGSIEMPDTKLELEEGDVAYIPKGQSIAWVGNDLKVFIPCMPAWTSEQHKLLK